MDINRGKIKKHKELKKQLTGRSPLRRQRPALDCSAISEEEKKSLLHVLLIT
jgi:hypothetical protein